MNRYNTRIFAIVLFIGILSVALGCLFVLSHTAMMESPNCAPYGLDFCIFSNSFKYISEYVVPFRGTASVLGAISAIILLSYFLLQREDSNHANSSAFGVLQYARSRVSQRDNELIRWLSLHEKRDPAIA